MRTRAKILWGLALVVASVATFFVVMIGPRNIIGMLRYDQRQEGTLRVGDRAPETVLSALDGQDKMPLRFGNRGRPLVLVFGSFT